MEMRACRAALPGCDLLPSRGASSTTHVHALQRSSFLPIDYPDRHMSCDGYANREAPTLQRMTVSQESTVS